MVAFEALSTESAPLLTVKALASRLGLSERNIYRQSDAGNIPRPLKLGRLNRWNPAEINAWIAGGCRPSRN